MLKLISEVYRSMAECDGWMGKVAAHAVTFLKRLRGRFTGARVRIAEGDKSRGGRFRNQPLAAKPDAACASCR
jgi:hypothetical protein